MSHIQYDNIISQFQKDAIEEFNKADFYPRHIDELIPSLANQASKQLSVSLELYRTLIEKYREQSNEVMAMLVIVTQDSTSPIGNHQLAELFQGGPDLVTPPLLYLVKRKDNRLPHVVEEYKLPIQQEIIKPSYGCIYAYYRSHRNDAFDTYGQGFYFEHYPSGNAEHEWE